METEVSCLRRRLAKEDRGRIKKPQLCVCVECVCVLSDLSKSEGWRACTGAVAWACMCQQRWGHLRLLPQETSAITAAAASDHLWVCLLVSPNH